MHDETPLTDERVPDYAEPIVGWRTWLLTHGAEPRLRSLFTATVWEPHGQVEACCVRSGGRALPRFWRRPAEHQAPSAPCSCGIHAMKGPGAAVSYLHHAGISPHWSRVIGQVLLWGEVVECEQGWRAERAYPERLYVPSQRGQADAGALHRVVTELRAYGVPVSTIQYEDAGDLAARLSHACSDLAA